MPGRGKKGTTKTDPAKPLPNFAGTLKRLDSKTIEVELDDFRTMEFRRTGTTKFFRERSQAKDAEAKSTDFKAGDHISVEATEDPGGYMTAVNVYLEAPASDNPDKPATKAGDVPAARDADDPGPPVLKRGNPAPRATRTPDVAGEKPASDNPDKPAAKAGDAPAAPAASKTADEPSASIERGTEDAPPPAPRDPDDPGPPVLKRGKPAPRSARSPEVVKEAPRETASTLPPPAPAPAAASRKTAAEPPARISPSEVERIDESRPAGHADDQFIRKAQEAALEFTETLPNYVCQEMVSRFQSESHPVSWTPIDVVTTDLVYEGGKESYRNLTINGKKSTKSPEESGSWSTGEFGTILIDLFSPATSASFHFRKTSRIAGIDTRLYDFDVKRENSHWNVRTGSQSYLPAYSGSVWIDPRSGRVMRIEMQARNMPDQFPLDKVESAVDYENIRLATTQTYLLPVHAETLSCQRGTSVCSRNAIDFRNYHKYTGESSITFEQQK